MSFMDGMTKIYPFVAAAIVFEFCAGSHGISDFYTTNSQTEAAGFWAVVTFMITSFSQIVIYAILSILTEIQAIRKTVEKISQNSN